MSTQTKAPTRNTKFASDNTSGMCPEAFEAYATANKGYLRSYGNDSWTQRAADMLRDVFETDCEVFFVFNGTAANSLALATCCQSYHSVICYQWAHIQDDECGAPEFFSNGTKLLGAEGEHGKLRPPAIEQLALKRSDLHYPKPHVVSLTQSTELGTVYSLAELAAIREVTVRHELYTHMDGARFAYAVASLGVTPAEVTWKAGVDVLCFGGTKIGMAGSEAVIFFNRELAKEFEYRCKQAGQLASKMRFLAAGWVGMLENNVWLKYAAQANRSAALLAKRLKTEANLSPAHPVEANAVFVKLPQALAQRLNERGWEIHDFIGGVSRMMCSWQTTEGDIEELMKDIKGIQKGV